MHQNLQHHEAVSIRPMVNLLVITNLERTHDMLGLDLFNEIEILFTIYMSTE